MIRRVLTLAASSLLLAVVLAGCKESSRAYRSDLDTTWKAVCQVTDSMHNFGKLETDHHKHRIKTDWTIQREVRETSRGVTTQGPYEVRRETTVRNTHRWRAVISCKSVGELSEVRVTVDRIEISPGSPDDHQYSGRAEDILASENDPRSWEARFFAELEAKLGKPVER